ncbi:MAG TPA: hypothetical protein VFV20_11250 [Candidatus Limnocylindria bacterium]|nr:hypothetical protein [Candidatus Limnocylindria bacterium]
MSRFARGVTLALVLAACQTAAPTATPSAASAGIVYGVAGLVRPHAPNSTAADAEAMYRSFAETGGALGVYTNWADRADTEGKVPAVVPAAFAAAKQYSFGPLVIALGVAADAGGTGVKSTIDWSSTQRERFLATVTQVARDHRPRFLALGVETNRLWLSDRTSFDGFVRGYADAYDAVKKVSPDTKVFTIFQLELMRGHATRMTGRDDEPQWDLLERFAGRLDLLGLTTYPFLEYQRPSDLPEDYYSDAARRLRAPVAFTEIGWPSARPASAVAAYDASPDDQAEFVARFFALTAGMRPAIALWSFPFELGVPSSLFDSVGIRRTDGAAKPALAAWQRGIRTK